MSNGGRKFTAMEMAHRYREIPCADCGEPFIAYGTRTACPPCKVARKQTPEGKQKSAAQQAVVRAVATGALVRQPCVACVFIGVTQKGISHGHHEDYSKPLDVMWLCCSHHRLLHRYGHAFIFQKRKTDHLR